MFKIITILMTSFMIAHAGMFDFITVKNAKSSYSDSNYTQAITNYKKLANKSDEAKYDLANSYYKTKDYKKAKEYYTKIKKPSLEFAKWHNIGNCEANLGNIDEGIKAYEKALKIKEDSDTRYNLELLKKKKEEKKKDQKKKDQKKKNDQKNNNKKNDKNKDKKDQKKNDQNKKKNKNKENKKDKKDDKKNKNQNKSKDKQDEKKMKQEKMKQEKDKSKKAKNKKQKTENIQKAIKKDPISDKEVAKYLKMLDKRGVNTLLVPLNSKGDKNEETTPW